MGGYGFLRFSLPMFPVASHDFAPLIFTLSVVAIIYTSLVALMQEDVKKLIAYSSVAHMGFVTMGIFALTAQGIAGGIFQMISHGIVSGALFLCVGVVYDRMHTREIAFYGGLVNRMPVFAFVFMVFTLANVGLPGTSGFVGEFLSLIGTFKANNAVATFATLGVILSAAYALWLYRKMIFGTLKPALVGIKDMGWREILIFTPLVALTILFGVAPKPVLDMSAASVVQLLDNYKHALAAANVPAKDATTGSVSDHDGTGRDDPSERRPMNQFMQMQGLMPLLPEAILAIGAMVMLMAGVIAFQSERSSRIVNGFCIAIAGAGGVRGGDDAARPLPNCSAAAWWSTIMRASSSCLALAGSGGALMLSINWLTVENQQKFEYGVLFLLSTLGMMLLISANDLIALYLGLEMMSLPLYVVAASNRDNVKSTEAGLKYFVLGALSSGMLLYGASLIYGFTGTISFAGIAKATHAGRQSRADLRPGVHVRRLLLQDFGGAVPHVDARRL